MLSRLLNAECTTSEWYRWEAFKLAQFYVFGKPIQPVASEEPTAPIKIDIRAIPLKRELASKSSWEKTCRSSISVFSRY